MLTRLVRMYIQPERVEDFVLFYEQIRPQIARQPGCVSVQLLRQADDPSAFATWSIWESSAALDAYRSSEVFRSFWPQVKRWFRQPAEAVSFEPFE
jgi:quinol monooxygenase YgiN